MTTRAHSRQVSLVQPVDLPPERAINVARLADESGFDGIWSGEDFFFNGGFAWWGTALAHTQRVPVGMGLLSAMVRHPAVVAMEVATLEGAHPGRVALGVGLGHIPWLNQMRLMPRSPLRAVRDYVDAVRQLLAGERMSLQTPTFAMTDVQLARPPAHVPPLFIGGWRSKMLRLAGEVGDGALLGTEIGGPDYIAWAREEVEEGAAQQSGSGRPTVYTFTRFAVGSDSQATKRRARHALAECIWNISRNPSAFEVYGIDAEVRALDTNGGIESIAAKMPERWIDDLAVIGDQAECWEKIERLHRAGADNVLLYPIPTDETEGSVASMRDDLIRRRKERDASADSDGRSTRSPNSV